MKILFAGTPAIAVPTLRAIASVYPVSAVLTNPDRPAGRKHTPEPSPVKSCALELGIEVFQPEKLDAEFTETLLNKGFDTLITFAFGKIFKENFLSIFTGGAFNIHPSLLPLHRGAAPINAAILNGDTETGISIQKMALKMDSGDIVMQTKFPLSGTETGISLTADVAEKCAALISDFMKNLTSGTLTATPQNDAKATYCSMISKEDGRIDWKESASLIERKIRAYQPWPLCYTTAGDRTIAITQASIYTGGEFADTVCGTVLGVDKKHGIVVRTGDGMLAIQRLKPQTKNEMDFKSFLNGAKNFIGTVLGEIDE